ncbi:MAG TPA: DUF1801 domain-containing protein [Gemmatimonadaceae bacterium]|nr:DUF1801 domain-containing protein [Gemmatimonadaceae bacterium]
MSTTTPETQLKTFIEKFDRRNQALIRAARRTIRERVPTATELVYDNYNFFVIGYSPTLRPSDSVFSIAAAANGVNLYFTYGARLPDPHHILRGSGSQGRGLRLSSADVLDKPEVKQLITAAIAAGKPMPKTSRGKLVIQSVSAKQRPRQRRAN